MARSETADTLVFGVQELTAHNSELKLDFSSLEASLLSQIQGDADMSAPWEAAAPSVESLGEQATLLVEQFTAVINPFASLLVRLHAETVGFNVQLLCIATSEADRCIEAVTTPARPR